MKGYYDYAEAIENLETLMDEAWIAGYVKIRQRDGRDFMLRPWELRSPLDELEVMLAAEHLVAEGAEAEFDPEDAFLPMVPLPENGKAA